MAETNLEDFPSVESGEEFPEELVIRLQRGKKKKYGENGQQGEAYEYSTGSKHPLALDKFDVIEGNVGTVNTIDLSGLINTITFLTTAIERTFGFKPKVALAAKHGNCCGAAFGTDEDVVLQKMIEGDLRAIFGGVILTNFNLTPELATILRKHRMDKGRRMLDLVAAPGYEEGAIGMLHREGGKGCKILVNPNVTHDKLGEGSINQEPIMRQIEGGFVLFRPSPYIFTLSDPNLTKYGQMTPQQERDTALAWAIGSTSNSNTIVLCRDDMLIAPGYGQCDRVGAAKLAGLRASEGGHDTRGSSAYSDSFFPFDDGPKYLVDELGVGSIFATSGSIRDGDTILVCSSAGVPLYMIPDSMGRGFSKHCAK